MKKDSPSKPLLFLVEILLLCWIRNGSNNEEGTRLQSSSSRDDRSIISSRSRFFVVVEIGPLSISSSSGDERLPSVVCNYRSREGVTHRIYSVYTGRVFADTGRDDNINRETSVCLRHDDEIGGENRFEGVRNEGARCCLQAKCLLCAFIAGLCAPRGITRIRRNRGRMDGISSGGRFFTDI